MNSFWQSLTKERHLSPQFIAAVKRFFKVLWYAFVIIVGTLFLIAMGIFALYGISAILAILFGGCKKCSGRQ